MTISAGVLLTCVCAYQLAVQLCIPEPQITPAAQRSASPGAAQDAQTTITDSLAALRWTRLLGAARGSMHRSKPKNALTLVRRLLRVSLENRLRGGQFQGQPIRGVTAFFAADRLAHHLHIEKIRRANTHA
jgi:hypothetical protein